MRIFHKPGDFAAFERVLAEGLERYPVELFTYSILSNHWHLVLRPKTDAALGQLMGWMCVTHVRRHHEHYHTRGGGHIYQGRFKSFPVAEDDYFLTLCRYVEANALRAEIVQRRWRTGTGAACGGMERRSRSGRSALESSAIGPWNDRGIGSRG